MIRISAWVGVLTAIVLMTGLDVSACGDKSLSAGGIRMQRALAARYPASVLMYLPSASRLNDATRELKLQETLRQVGHKYQEVTTWSELQAAIVTGRFNIVIADLSDLAELQQKLASSSSHVVIVPVAYQLTKAETATAAKESRFLIKAPSRAAQYLMTIAEAVRSGSSVSKKS
jgi:hypothetical protein